MTASDKFVTLTFPSTGEAETRHSLRLRSIGQLFEKAAIRQGNPPTFIWAQPKNSRGCISTTSKLAQLVVPAPSGQFSVPIIREQIERLVFGQANELYPL